LQREQKDGNHQINNNNNENNQKKPNTINFDYYNQLINIKKQQEKSKKFSKK